MNRRTLILSAAAIALMIAATVRHGLASMETTDSSTLARGAPARAGTFPARWIAGLDCENDPFYQVHQYNRDTFILRQSKCISGEGPFLYLLFGNEYALLLDTGAPVPELGFPLTSGPVDTAVFDIVDQWSAANGLRTPIPLIVAHTHGHIDHVAGDMTFNNHPRTKKLVSSSFNSMIEFFGFENYPSDQPTLDLGGRVLDVIGTPGHHPASVTIYDRQTQLLLTGDIVYPGHLFVFSGADWHDFVKSIHRLVVFASQNPVTWVLGCHIEYSDKPGRPYPWATTMSKHEHVLQLDPNVLLRIYEAALEQNGDPECTIYDDFVIHPVYKCGITWNGD